MERAAKNGIDREIRGARDNFMDNLWTCANLDGVMRVEKRIRRLVVEALGSSNTRPEPLIRALTAGVPAARRIAAIGLGRMGDAAYASLLEQQLQVERCSTVRASLGLALVQCGAGEEEVARACTQAPRLRTTTGFREVELVLPVRLHQVLDSGPDELRERVVASPDGAGESLLALCMYQFPGDLEWVERVRRAGGRRAEHLCLEALGILGQPESLPVLVEALGEFDVDPGRGFARRRIAAVALGRLGIPGAWRALSKALVLEAAEHEGSPGAGLGIQYPVRSAILWGLGELQVQRAAPLMCDQLAEISASPLGGLHLPAMEALWKMGEPAKPALESMLRSSDALAAVHAACVLEALGRPECLSRLANGDGAVAHEARKTLTYQ